MKNKTNKKHEAQETHRLSVVMDEIVFKTLDDEISTKQKREKNC